jgi:hypothetical protein
MTVAVVGEQMIELNKASAAGLWGSGLDSAGSVANAAERLAGRALDGAGWQELVSGSIPVLIVLAIGLALWLVGDRLFRPASSLVGAGVGALFGLWASTVIQTPTLGNIPTAYVTIGVGSLLGLAIGAAMYRIAIGASGGLVLGCAAGVVTIAVHLHTPNTLGHTTIPERPETTAEAAALRAEFAITSESAASVVPVGFAEQLSGENLREFASAAASGVGSLVKAEWAAVPDTLRPLALGAAILGCVVGFAAGLLKPKTIGPAVAALAGAALWLGATTVLLTQAGNAPPIMPSDQPLPWLGAWIGVAVIGFIVQRRVGKPTASLAGDG